MSWLKLGSGELVNLDHIASVEMIDMTPAKKNGNEVFHVALYPVDGDADRFKACEGSRSKCEDYLCALLEFVGGKEICAVGTHKCECHCGCQAEIRESFEICDDCATGDHFNGIEIPADLLKKEAA